MSGDLFDDLPAVAPPLAAPRERQATGYGWAYADAITGALCRPMTVEEISGLTGLDVAAIRRRGAELIDLNVLRLSDDDPDKWERVDAAFIWDPI